MRILLVEDDAETAAHVRRELEAEGHVVHIEREGRSGLARATRDRWDLFIVDRMLPELEGIPLVETLRGSGCPTPVLMLTTLGGVEDRVQGLNAGADDYLVKPFAFAELKARVAALARRASLVPQTSMRFADLAIDLLSREVVRGGERIELLPREFRLLEYLMRHAEQVVTRTMLLEHVWDVHFDPNTSVVETHISRLRSKVDRGNAHPLIHTIRGAGYSLRAQGWAGAQG